MVMLREMFSPIGGNNTYDDSIDYVHDLKIFIDNENKLLSGVLFPAVKKQMFNPKDPDSYKLYVKPLQTCKEQYRDKFNIDRIEEKIKKEDLIELAKHIAKEQCDHIVKGDYDVHK